MIEGQFHFDTDLIPLSPSDTFNKLFYFCETVTHLSVS